MVKDSQPRLSIFSVPRCVSPFVFPLTSPFRFPPFGSFSPNSRCHFSEKIMYRGARYRRRIHGRIKPRLDEESRAFPIGWRENYRNFWGKSLTPCIGTREYNASAHWNRVTRHTLLHIYSFKWNAIIRIVIVPSIRLPRRVFPRLKRAAFLTDGNRFPRHYAPGCFNYHDDFQHRKLALLLTPPSSPLAPCSVSREFLEITKEIITPPRWNNSWEQFEHPGTQVVSQMCIKGTACTLQSMRI